jgi:hypothetical protein
MEKYGRRRMSMWAAKVKNRDKQVYGHYSGHLAVRFSSIPLVGDAEL